MEAGAELVRRVLRDKCFRGVLPEGDPESCPVGFGDEPVSLLNAANSVHADQAMLCPPSPALLPAIPRPHSRRATAPSTRPAR